VAQTSAGEPPDVIFGGLAAGTAEVPVTTADGRTGMLPHAFTAERTGPACRSRSDPRQVAAWRAVRAGVAGL